ncbi:LPS translocon maturation chaperone LptM [Polaromonas sp.]|uniref:LPS translocon maturation chaperone LptM n=1 Tax=Polaromonas sp. TaxID=1869339 RepID=UPI003CC53B27
MFARSQIRFQILGLSALASWAHGLWKTALTATGAVCLVACGQKGPLFMPPPPKAFPASVSPSTAPAPAASASSPAGTATDLPAAPPASGPAVLPSR